MRNEDPLLGLLVSLITELNKTILKRKLKDNFISV